MRLLALLTTVVLLTAGGAAWAWLRSMPGGQHWPAIPEPGGVAGFRGVWLPQGCDDAWTGHGNMTLRDDGRISYTKKTPYLPTQYRTIETTPYYAVLMTRHVSTKHGEILRFVILQSVSGEAPRNTLGWNECIPDPEDLRGFSWTDDDATLVRAWANAKSCNPAFKEPYEANPFFGARGWSQDCKSNRLD